MHDKTLMTTIALGLVLLVLAAGPAAAETRYVSDVLVVSLRAEPAAGAALVRTVLTGTHLEVLEDKEAYLRVRTPEGEEGWVRSQYVSTETPKAEVIAWFKKETARLKKKLEELEARHAATAQKTQSSVREKGDRIRELEKALKESRAEAARLTTELNETTTQFTALQDNARDVVTITAERDRLLAGNERLTNEVDHLVNENRRLMRTGMIKWFLAGGGVLLVGWFAGKRSRRKRFY